MFDHFSSAVAASYSLAFTSVWLWLIVLAFVVTIILTYFYYHRTNPMLSGAWRITLGVLRGLALAALFFVFAEPLVIVKSEDVKEPTVAVLVDNSASMRQNRESGPQFERMSEILKEVSDRIPPGARVLQYAVSDSIRANAPLDGSQPVTALGDALDYLAAAMEEENLRRVILLSDGSSNLGRNPASEAKQLGVPITTVGFGDPNPLPDIKIVDVKNNPVGFVGKEFPVEVTIESRGFDKVRLPVRLKQGNATLTERDIDLVGEGRQQSVELKFEPQNEGELVLELSIPVQQNEESQKNNNKQIQVKIRKSQIKILLASAYLNWEFGSMRKALEAKQDFQVDQYIESPQRITGSIPFPSNVDGLSEYDALILYDFDAAWLQQHEQLLDAFFDRTGKGMLFIAGENFGNHTKRPLQSGILPYDFAELRTVVEQRVQFNLTEHGKIHPLLRLSEDGEETQRRLQQLPPFLGYLDAINPRREAVILAEVPAQTATAGMVPIMAAQRYRNGKVACLSAFPLWRLDMVARGANSSDSTFAKLMENSVLWLVSREDLERITILPAKPIFISGESVDLQARVLDESYIAVEDAQVEAALISRENPADTTFVSFRYDRPGYYSAELHYLPPGNYKVNGTVKRSELAIGAPNATFVVEPYTLEDLSQISNFDLLKRVSELSGGEFYTVNNLAEMPEFSDLQPETIVRRSEFVLFDNIYILILIILLLCVEWYLRKRWQLL